MNWVDPGQNQVGIPYHECFNSISYTGSLSHLHRLLTKWRHSNREQEIKVKLPAEESRAIDPATGWQISPIVAAALCMNPSKMLTPPQAVKVDALERSLAEFRHYEAARNAVSATIRTNSINGLTTLNAPESRQ